MDTQAVRLNKFLAETLGVSRRAADTLIQQGRVIINGKTAELGARVCETDLLSVDGRQLSGKRQQEFTYLMLHKPRGYVSSRRKQGGSETIYALLPQQYHHLKPVGRLDRDSSGLLLLTNDGDFAHAMTHPKFYKTKQYEVTLDKALAPLHRQMVNDHGVQLDDGTSRLTLERLHEGNDTEWIVTMHEGRNRQIRRTFSALGYEVTRLHRTAFGPYILAVGPGKTKKVSKL